MLQQQASDFQKTNRHIFGEEFAARPSSPSSRSFGRPWWCASTLAADWKNGATVTWLIPVLNVGNGCEWSIVTIRRKFRSQTSDNMDRWKAEQGRGREKRKIRRKKMQMREKVGKSRNAGAEPFGRMRDEQLHAVVARSTFRSQNIENTPFSDHFWKLRCRKSARRCGAKHICKSKCTKHLSVGPLLEVTMSKKCTPLWREAHFQVKMYKTSKCTKHTMYGPFLEVQMSKKCMPLWREAHFEVKMCKTHHSRTTFGSSDVVSRGRRKGLWTLSKVSKTWGFCSIFNYDHHYTTLHSNTLHYTTTTTTPSLHSTTLHSTTLHCTQLHSITLHKTTLHYTTLHYLPLHYITLHYTTLHYTTLHYTTLPSTTLHYTTLHSTTLHYTTLQLQHHNYTPLHSTTLNYTTLHYITLH